MEVSTRSATSSMDLSTMFAAIMEKMEGMQMKLLETIKVNNEKLLAELQESSRATDKKIQKVSDVINNSVDGIDKKVSDLNNVQCQEEAVVEALNEKQCKTKIKCYNCRKIGHTQRNCRAPRKRTRYVSPSRNNQLANHQALQEPPLKRASTEAEDLVWAREEVKDCIDNGWLVLEPADVKSGHVKMPKIESRSSSSKSYPCRICKRPHPLRTCRKFLAMNMNDRIHAVRKHKYCSNCLAHDHSQGTCLSKHGCKHCHKYHHTLLHVNPRLAKDLLSDHARSRSPSPQRASSSRTRKTSSSKSTNDSLLPSTSKSASLTAILRQNTLVLLPTVLVKVGSTTSHARCLLDSGSTVSRVAKKFVDKLDLTAFTLHEETVCPIVLKSRFDSSSKLEGTFRVDNRISIHTPSESLPESYKKNFRDLFLADSKFYESAPIDIIIGADLYPKVIREGVFSRTGFPTAQSSMFGWTIYGPCSL
ncbi:uncharacterized protein LOC135950620 [Calliphora vicina]|uniref:uncharacterized protein LOC135950620 n=1 Tax=Calliphora vicina TaxID=7373 RepID=UPI00325AD97B